MKKKRKRKRRVLNKTTQAAIEKATRWQSKLPRTLANPCGKILRRQGAELESLESFKPLANQRLS